MLRSGVLFVLLAVLGTSGFYVLQVGAEESAFDLYKKVKAFYEQGKYAEAIPIARRVVELRRERSGENSADYATSLNDLAALYKSMGEYDKAEPLYQQAMETYRSTLGEDHPYHATSLNNLAALYRSMGEYGKAEPLYQKAMKIDRKVLGEDHPSYATTLKNLADLYSAMGEYDRAELLFKQAVEIKREALGEGHPSYATSLNSLAALYKSMGEYGKAEPLFKQIMEIQRKALGEDHPDYGGSLNNLAWLYKSMGEYAKAESLYQQAMKIDRKVLGEVHPYHATSLHNLAELYADVGEYGKAEPLYQQALEIKRKVLGEDHPDYAASQWDYAALLARTDRVQESLPRYEMALAAYEATRGKIAIETQRTSYLGTMENAYAMAAATYRKAGKPGRAFETVERGRAKSLMDLFATRQARGGRIGDMSEVEAIERRINQLRDERIKIATVPAGEKKTRSIQQILAKETEESRKRLALVEQKERAHPELGSLLTVSPPKLGEIQQLLDPDVVLLEYFHPGKMGFADGEVDELWIFVVMANKGYIVPVSVTQKELRETARQYAELVSAGDPGELAGLSAKLYGWLVEPVREKLTGCDTVVIVPWDVLFYLPFSALAPEEGAPPFGAEKRVVVSTSAGVYRYIKPKRASKHEAMFALGNPESPQIPLEQAEEETRTVARLFKESEMLLRSDATETAVKAGVGEADVVHFACHGILNEKLPQLSHLLLTADAENDGKLEVHEIFGLDWQGVSLVTLSACSSGKGKLGAGDDIIGLTRGFMFAGAPTVLCTLWEVDDESTRIFMEEFYRQYTSGKSKPESLQLAQAKLRNEEQWSHPYHWAPFVLWGDWK